MAIPFNQRLETICREKNNSLCIGLDIDPDKFSSGVDTSLSGMESFGKDIIDATIDFVPYINPTLHFLNGLALKVLHCWKDWYHCNHMIPEHPVDLDQ